MSDRIVIKITGAAGQGIKTSGLLIAKALKRAGYYTFGYTEYPSLIRGGHNIFQIDVSTVDFASSSNKLNVLLALDQNSIKNHAKEIEANGVLILDEGTCSLDEETHAELDSRKIEIFSLNLLNLAQSVGGTGIMKNTVTLGALWSVLDQDIEILNQLIQEIFPHKSEEIRKLNINCLKAGFDSVQTKIEHFDLAPFAKEDKREDAKSRIIISGNEAIGLGAIASGVRLYSSYPMTPASSILSFLAVEGTKKGMIVKQAEDEITAANMVVGASYAGTRAMCGTSGGGFDLMTEAISLAGMTETPFVCVLAQRPGPATGVPTWTAQADLNLAIHSSHGEFAKIVLAAGDPEEAFLLTGEAQNLAEKYQTPVILLTDKYLAESFYSTKQLSENSIKIDRGQLISTGGADKLRYTLSDNGISDRWLPGDQINTFLANSDEHTPKGYSTEVAQDIADMISKRAKKIQTITEDLPNPILYGSPLESSELLVISWGSNKPIIIDSINKLAEEGLKISFMHIQYLWPLKSTFINQIVQKAKKTVVMECNKQGQLADLLEYKTGLKFESRILKFDGRPFFFEEALNSIKSYIS